MKLLALEIGTFKGIGPLGTLAGNTGEAVFGQFEGVISTIIGVLTVSAGLWFLFQFFGGALQWLASGGEKQALQNAQKRIANALVGLLIVVMSYTLIAIIGAVIGLNILSPWDALHGVAAPGGGYTGGPVPTCAPGDMCLE